MQPGINESQEDQSQLGFFIFFKNFLALFNGFLGRKWEHPSIVLCANNSCLLCNMVFVID